MMFLRSRSQRTPEETEKILDLRAMVEESDELQIGTEDVLLTKFLNYVNWNVTKAYECIQRYYDFKQMHPNWVANHSVEYYSERLYSTRSKFVMPQPDKNGRVLVIFKTVDAFDRYPSYMQDIIELDDIIFESLLLLPKVQQNGITIILDMTGTTRNFLRLLSPSMARMINEKNDILPFKKRIVHIIQRGLLMNAATALVMPFMSKEFKDHVYTHDGKNFDKLREMIGYENLPAEYGGPRENVLDVNLISNHLQQNAKYLRKLQTYTKRT